MKNRLFNGFLILALVAFWAACGGEKKPDRQPIGANDQLNAPKPSGPETHGAEIKNVELGAIDEAKVTVGKGIYDLKCAACHKLTADKLVGPGWAGVTKRREPTWIMNMTTNVEMMLEKDSVAQALLEQCLVRMPNQNVSETEARALLEFMRKNDGVK